MSTALINVLMVFFAMLLIVVIVLVTRVIILKREIKSIGNQLKETREKSYNKQVQIALIDNDLSEMTLQVNKNLDYQKQLKLNQEKIEKQMKQSISDIAHDLRTPLTVIKGNLQMICKDQGISDQNLEYIKICEEKADTLKEMVDGFFELSVLESDQNEVPIHKVNATNILMQFVIDHEALIREKNLVPEISFPEKTINILGDEAFINRMLSNLLNNILKYGKNGFRVELVEKPDELVSIKFSNRVESDNHIDTERMFDRTYRADRARHENGAGLGLYIVKLLAEKQNASVNAYIENNNLVIEMIFLGCN